MKEAPLYESQYIDGYDDNNAPANLAGYFLAKSHVALEREVPLLGTGGEILEVGSGSGHHFPYVRKNFSRYHMTDGSAQMLQIAAKKHADAISAGILLVEQQDATNLTYEDSSFDRLIATHVLEHLPAPVEVLKEWNRVVKPGGIISLVLPCDPGMLWRLGRYLGPRRNAVKMGLPYDYLQAAEHINAIFNLVTFVKYHFTVESESWYPFKLPLPDLNLFYVCHLRVEK